ncbi:MAG: hypothetical protein IIB38_11385 [Candidatus Hydrogenedentes bacterium]|nr:hypothetical protein [Candidatus Hydrogenedentota bacterium]
MADANQHTEQPSPQEVKERLEALDQGTLDGAEDDFRFKSSVPPAQQMDELDFIQMSGLSAPPDEAGVAEVPAQSVPAAAGSGAKRL